MRADNVFVTNAHILYHFIAKMSIVFPFRSSGAAPARLQKAVILPSVMPRFAPFYHRRRAGFPYRAGKGQSRLSKRPHILTKSKPPLWGDAIRDAYTDEKTTAHHVPALRHRSDAGTILPLPCPHSISPPPRRFCRCPALNPVRATGGCPRRRKDSTVSPTGKPLRPIFPREPS